MSSKSLSKTQKEKVSQFQSITGMSTKHAVEYLQLTNWSLEPAIDYLYSSGNHRSSSSRIDRAALAKFFGQYKDPNNDAILAEGIIKLCEDLGVEPEDPVVLVLSWHMEAEAMGEYSKSEFENGMESLGVDSIDKLKSKIPKMRQELSDPGTFREIYNYAYLFSREKGQKFVQLDTAIAMWQLLISPIMWQYIGEWCEYLREHHKRTISKDTWGQLLDFMRNVKEDFSNYDENGAWPYLIDEFVAYQKEKQTNGTNGHA